MKQQDNDEFDDYMDEDSIDINSDEAQAILASMFPNDDDGMDYSNYLEGFGDD
ncbi:hypothetical protein [Porphyromonas uenonis]|uniref:hypothetical protein n=1 Tax=Porphyromonas uenonis TaxID=281920 RepID=UPI0026EF264B|nr:hypothetical protein [Porphyromonas uenonis]